MLFRSFVVNHILVETLFNLVILLAFLVTRLEAQPFSSARVLSRFVPVLQVSMVVMYYFAILAKLNAGFFDPQQSCVVVMFDDLCQRFPFVPENDWTRQSAIWGTILIESAIPVLLTFRRTQWLAILAGLAFHFMLGLIGHRTFSGLAYAVYGLFLLPALTATTNRFLNWLRGLFGFGGLRLAWKVGAVAAVGVVIGVTLAEYTGNYRAGPGPFKVYRFPWVIWISWSLLLGALYCITIRCVEGRETRRDPDAENARPGWLWLFVVIVFCNGCSQYLGLKTETCFTMYSNLRTEGGVNNHLFMPALRIAGFQDDLVEILETDNRDLLENYLQKENYITAFEFHRLISSADEEFFVEFRHEGKVQRIDLVNSKTDSHPFLEKQNLFMRKLLFFRPVPKSDLSPCQH